MRIFNYRPVVSARASVRCPRNATPSPPVVTKLQNAESSELAPFEKQPSGDPLTNASPVQDRQGDNGRVFNVVITLRRDDIVVTAERDDYNPGDT